ncbi:YihY/virulence factor BrkB family protein [Aggregicoccus sp. 17bor-14]|uniref:YihY/virulence factor BrkB family protein n=1 Tax=Myxococcaceae TaxID=31 RepID=UPI0012F2AA78|nr:YihY/virulence factor BrkB family protein [Simulacricoccus sp. 17bor-14]MRI91325.1 YihY/virulence factor BrkB family protein [Aggregicoccus sp. 17bor-14]
MARPGKTMGWMKFFKTLKDEWGRDRVSNTAAALTFFSVLALFPFLLFLVSLAGIIIDPKQAEQLVQQLATVAPREATDIIAQRLRDLASSDSVGLLTVGGAGALWAASGGMVALMEALNIIYGVKETRPFWKVRGIALMCTLGGALIALLAALVAVATPAIAARLGEPLGSVVLYARLPVAGLLMMLLWAALYYLLPDVEQEFKFLTFGSIVGVALWVLASYGFSKYVANFGSYDANYGALGGVIVMLMWMWISGQVILLGAEINAVLEHKSPDGKSPGQHELGEGGPAATKTELEKGGASLPGNTDFHPPRPPARKPPPPMQPPGLAAAIWAAGFGLGVVLLRRGTRA